jgi:hypothetical protein
VDEELPVGRLSDVEPVEQGEGLIGLGSDDVGLARLVWTTPGLKLGRCDSRACRDNDVDDFNAADRLLRRNLAGSMAGGDLHIDHFTVSLGEIETSIAEPGAT